MDARLEQLIPPRIIDQSSPQTAQLPAQFQKHCAAAFRPILRKIKERAVLRFHEMQDRFGQSKTDRAPLGPPPLSLMTIQAGLKSSWAID